MLVVAVVIVMIMVIVGRVGGPLETQRQGCHGDESSHESLFFNDPPAAGLPGDGPRSGCTSRKAPPAL